MTFGRAQTAASLRVQAQGRSGRTDAVLFDMDRVVTDTASARAAAWMRLFDEYLRQRAQRSGDEITVFDIDTDYREYVDGKPRCDGVKSFLESRGIELPFADPGDGPDTETVCGLGNRKNRYFHGWLAENRVRIYPSTINLLQALRDAGIGGCSRSRGAESASSSGTAPGRRRPIMRSTGRKIRGDFSAC